MSEKDVRTHETFVLPPTVVTRVDISRLVGEVERVDNDMTATDIRAKTGASEQTQPVLSEQLADFLRENDLSLQTGDERTRLIKELRQLKQKVPVLHMTFAVTADMDSLQQLTQWVRTTIHPQAVIAVGLQPALVAGVYLRTPNHIHDLSLRARLQGSHDVLVKELETLGGK
jgi:hypothetical protein